MDPVTIGLLLAGITSSMMGSSSANAISRQNLDFQKQNAADQMKFAKAGRTDAFGNTTNFSDALNEWITQLTPQQQRLIKAGEHEQQLSLTEDAGRNRNVQKRAFNRGVGAEDDYNSALSGYRYDKPHSEQSIMNELTNLITQSRGTGDRAEAALAGRQGIRQGGNLPIIYGGGDNGASRGGGEKLAQVMLQARQSAMNESQSRDTAHNNKYLPALQQFGQTAMGGGNAPIRFSTTPQDQASLLENLSKGVGDAYTSGASALNTASGSAAKIAGSGPGISDYAKLIAAMKDNGGKKKTDDAAFYGGSPGTNALLRPSTYGNRNWLSSDYGDFIL